MLLKLVTIFLLLFFIFTPAASAQGPVHTKLKIRTDESNNFHPVTVLGERIHLWEKEYGNEIKIHIFDKRLNLQKHVRIQTEKGQLSNIVFTSFNDFYYAFIFTKIKNYFSIQLLKVEEDGIVSALKLPEFLPARINLINEMHIEKKGDDILLFRRLPASLGLDRSILIQQFDSSLKPGDHHRVYTPIAKSLDLSWKILDNGIIYFAGTCVNKNVENVLVVEKVDISQKLAIRSEYLCGNNEFSSLNLFHDGGKGWLKIFCIEDHKGEDSDSSNLIVSVFTVAEKFSTAGGLEKNELFEPAAQNGQHTEQPDEFTEKSLREIYFQNSISPGKIHSNNYPYPLVGQVYELQIDEDLTSNKYPRYSISSQGFMDDSQTMIDGGKQFGSLVLPDSPNGEPSYFNEKLITSSSDLFRLYYNEPGAKNRYILKCIEIEDNLQYHERPVVANPRYYYLLNLAVKINDDSYIVPYKKGDLFGLSIHSF